jgi:hypothetical protein
MYQFQHGDKNHAIGNPTIAFVIGMWDLEKEITVL